MSTDTKTLIDSLSHHKGARICFWIFVGTLAFIGVINVGTWLGQHVTIFLH